MKKIIIPDNQTQENLVKNNCKNCCINFCLTKDEDADRSTCTRFVPNGFHAMSFKDGKWYDKVMNNGWYIDHCGSVCPFCKSNGVIYEGPVQTDSDIAWQNMSCNNCTNKWKSMYTLVGFQSRK